MNKHESIIKLENQLNGFLNENLSTPEGIKKLTQHYTINGLYNYSFYNSMLILMQGGTIAQSYKKWQKLNRYVKKGEKSKITICVPYFKKVKNENGEEEKKLIMFGYGKVFDIEQTDGEELQYDHNTETQTEYNYEDLKNILVGLINKNIFEDYTGEARGYVNTEKIVISKMSNNTDRIKTLLHEMVHELHGHVGSDKAKETKEVEAEATAAIVMSFLNIDYNLSAEYIKGYKTPAAIKEVEKIKIIKIAEKLIKAIKEKEVKKIA